MKQLNLRSIVVKKYRPQRSNKPIISKENLLNQDFSTETICEKWAADITYIPTKKNGWCYLSSIMDLHTKKIISRNVRNVSCPFLTDRFSRKVLI